MARARKNQDQPLRDAVRDLVNALNEGVTEAQKSLESRKLPFPKSIDELEHLARMTEIPAGEIGEQTFESIVSHSAAWGDREAYRAKLAAQAKIETDGPQNTGGESPQAKVANSKATQLEKLAKAMMLVNSHPEWSDAKIAKKIGCHPGTLSRSVQYQAAAKIARQPKVSLPKGEKFGNVFDAVAPQEAPVSYSDRGQPLPGSRFVREYCAGCDEPIGVTADQVGNSPVCAKCQQG